MMRENKSFVFFRELDRRRRSARWAMPVTAASSVAADAKFVPLGAPVFLSMDRADANGLWVAQDTGGAIKGANRFDTFWGAGDEARGDRGRHVGARHRVPAAAASARWRGCRERRVAGATPQP